ncbi:hypothetical protein AXE80_06545 [Wenyingzhuangia fucanilytica]|uniref:T9SS C-terminal target domain-containing protein n=2 Tax=Wenyingzhuangia fucanilytica TaxID=1790137 RepID=A0A1B1Y5E3_9FLAO|nr:hypothetical protein AXE80_06545 [Wenyingzhuangia fucanilytica]
MTAQNYNIERKVSLSNKISETSGIIYINNEIVTFNDSGGKPELYTINPYNGKTNRTIWIKNAKNIDWESITQDKEHIYVGDTGNNDGNRTDLVIYKISKRDFYRKNTVNAERILYSYEDQFIFEKQRHSTNFDCEAITIYHNQLLLFTKNWGDYHTKVYKIPTRPGRYEAIKIHSLDIGCMLTSIAYNPENNQFVGTAYDREYQSYIIRVKNFYLREEKIIKTNLTPALNYANQFEAIAWKNKNQIYITREYLKQKVNKKRYKNKQKMFLITLMD